MYHNIASPHKHKFYVTPENFRMQMEYISENGIKTIDLNNGIDGDVLITFDDGDKSNLEAARLLSQLGLKGVFYVVRDYSLNDPDYLNEEDIKEISGLGHTIGVHGYDHEWYTRKSKELLVAELDETAKWIETLTGKKVTTLSAPGGRITKEILQAIKKNLPYLKYIRNSVCYHSTDTGQMINSMPITIGLEMDEFKKIMHFNRFYYLKSYTVYKIKEVAKKLIYKIKRIE